MPSERAEQPGNNMRTIATAGHVDHGKSTLVHALTGMNPDRLQEELDRQMTIDLGFAWLTLEGGQEVGIVDVPGHRDFIENMLAGVGSVDAVLFVIAADEGIMPQTREHLAILDLLQIPRGIIVLTKVDLVEEEWLDLVKDDVRTLFSTTSLKDAPILAVSAQEKIGLRELKQELTNVLDETPARMDTGRPRLPIDRVFSLTGFGTVVTGTLIGGSLREGQEVVILPGGLKARIRNLQSHKSKREIVRPGGRVALNLSGLDKSEIERGDTVTLVGQWKTSTMIDAYFCALADLAAPIKHNQEVKLYHGAAQRMARIRLIGQADIKPGEEGWVQLVLADSIVADRGDKFILRRPSPGATLGGGEVLDPSPDRHYRMKDVATLERLQKLHTGDARDVVLEHIRRIGPISMDQAFKEIDLEDRDGVVSTLIEKGELRTLEEGGKRSSTIVMTASAWERFRSQSEHVLNEYHQRFPLRVGMPLQEYRTRIKLDPKWAAAFITTARSEAWIQQDGNFIRLPSRLPSLSQKQQNQVDDLLEEFKVRPFNTPSRKDILKKIDEEILQYLIWSEELVSVSEDVFFTHETYAYAVKKIRTTFEQQETISVAQVRDLFDTSRKYALALMEHLDERGITIREGDVRRIIV
jgi:selenocysteine-specific elongation factor